MERTCQEREEEGNHKSRRKMYATWKVKTNFGEASRTPKHTYFIIEARSPLICPSVFHLAFPWEPPCTRCQVPTSLWLFWARVVTRRGLRQVGAALTPTWRGPKLNKRQLTADPGEPAGLTPGNVSQLFLHIAAQTPAVKVW